MSTESEATGAVTAWDILGIAPDMEVQSGRASEIAAARSEGYAQARAEDIAALRSRQRAADHAFGANTVTTWEGTFGAAADYLASLTPTQEAEQ